MPEADAVDTSYGDQSGQGGDHAVCFEFGKQCCRQAGFLGKTGQGELLLITEVAELQADAVGGKKLLRGCAGIHCQLVNPVWEVVRGAAFAFSVPGKGLENLEEKLNCEVYLAR